MAFDLVKCPAVTCYHPLYHFTFLHQKWVTKTKLLVYVSGVKGSAGSRGEGTVFITPYRAWKADLHLQGKLGWAFDGLCL